MVMQAVPMGFFVYICPVGWLGHDESMPVCRALLDFEQLEERFTNPDCPTKPWLGASGLRLPMYACHAASVAVSYSMSSEAHIGAAMRS